MTPHDELNEPALARALRRIAKGTRLSCLDVPLLEDAADTLSTLSHAQDRLTQDRDEATDAHLPQPPCNLCGAIPRFDTSVPSVVWNEAVRAAGIPDFLCAACVLEVFAKRGESFTCELW